MPQEDVTRRQILCAGEIAAGSGDLCEIERERRGGEGSAVGSGIGRSRILVSNSVSTSAGSRPGSTRLSIVNRNTRVIWRRTGSLGTQERQWVRTPIGVEYAHRMHPTKGPNITLVPGSGERHRRSRKAGLVTGLRSDTGRSFPVPCRSPGSCFRGRRFSRL